MEVTARGATIEFDCGSGTIDGPIVLDRRSRFSARGTFTRGHGGPVRNDETNTGVAAIYSGKIVDDRMSLKITLAAPARTVITYDLTFGQMVKLRRCY